MAKEVEEFLKKNPVKIIDPVPIEELKYKRWHDYRKPATYYIEEER